MDAEKNISNNLTLDELSEVLDSGAIIKARNSTFILQKLQMLLRVRPEIETLYGV